MRMTLNDVRHANKVKEKVRRRGKASTGTPPTHIRDLCDEELNAMPLSEVVGLVGVTVTKSTISSRMANEDMSLREAAQTPPRTPKKHRPDQASKKRFYGYGR